MMSLRKVNPRVIVESKIMVVQAGLSDISNQELEAHYLSGGNVQPHRASHDHRPSGGHSFGLEHGGGD